jgi:FixJ family two-component response regulator
MMNNTIVYILDDDVDVRTTLSNIFRFNGFDVRTFSDPRDLLQHPLRYHDSCLILDLAMPNMGGLELQRHIREQGVVLPIIIYTGTASIESAVCAMSGGAFTVLQKPTENSKLVAAVKKAINEFKTKQNEYDKNREAFEQVAALTKREYEISLLIVEGLTSQAIAKKLFISARTVEAHRAAIFYKLHIKAIGPLAQLILRADLHRNLLRAVPVTS